VSSSDLRRQIILALSAKMVYIIKVR